MQPVYRVIFAFLLVLMTGCAGTPPVTDYNLARSAIDAAKKSGAPRYSPGYWSQAEEAFREASKLYKDRYYDNSKKMFRRARKMAEKAENSARLQKFKSGDGFL